MVILLVLYNQFLNQGKGIQFLFCFLIVISVQLLVLFVTYLSPGLLAVVVQSKFLNACSCNFTVTNVCCVQYQIIK